MSLQESLFSEYVERDIKEFTVKTERKRVLVFPPVNNYRRFIIHQSVQDQYHDLLYTFSIGQGAQRRTVVCYKTDVVRDPKLNGASAETCDFKVLDFACAMRVEGHRSALESPENTRQRQVKSVPSVGIYRPPPARKARCDVQTDSQQDQPASESSQASKANRQKRPDRAVYVPKHRRSNEAEGSSLSRETSRVLRSTRERRSTTSSPTRTSLRSCNDNSGAVSDAYNGTQEREREVEVSDVVTVLETDRNLSGALEIPIRQESSQTQHIIVDDVLNTSSSSSFIGNNDKVVSEILMNFEADVFLPSESAAVTEQSVDGYVKPMLKTECTPILNRVDNESRDACLMGEPGTVQTDAQFKEELQQCKTRLILSSCEAASSELEISEVRQSPMSVEKGEGDENIIESIKRDELYPKIDKNEESSDLIMSENRNKKKEETKDQLLNCDEVVNHKNRRIVRQNIVSDVLLITDEKVRQDAIINEPPAIPVSPSLPTKEKKVKKIERSKSKPAPPPLPSSKVNRDDCDWDSLFDDNGDCLDPSLIEELTTTVGEVTIEKPKSDYRAYSKAPVEVSNDEFAHVVEIYNFPSDFKTSDLAAVFSPFKNGGFELKWVDDTHCLGVFSSPLIAAEVLASDHSFVKTRPLSEATALSKTKARRSAEFLQPYRARPETCAALARRLVTGALGVRLATARQEREREKVVLREAKERRRLANKQRADAWQGVVAEK
ncbi:uncharacterized protein LOC107218897 isoform X2 [Neodiprion lecontei]|uniref:Uncharacterized protein LOC107218897 isoform X2 n=1 Tax=Neodiprion lecontei TaxID=441921 RepID=A0A6J0BBX4_NEOLC|nr:uncharacterized protein LOC107218897 isoform X2 [Neodiprion lecontei]